MVEHDVNKENMITPVDENNPIAWKTVLKQPKKLVVRQKVIDYRQSVATDNASSTGKEISC